MVKSQLTSRFSVNFCLSISFFMLVGCNWSETTPNIPHETYLPVPGAVAFDISPVPSKDGREWLAIYEAQGKTAKFRIKLGDAQDLDDKESQRFDVKSGKGRFVAEPGSDASVLLSELKVALEAKSLPANVRRVRTLPFTFVRLGNNNSQAPNGGFFADPPGNWTPMKIFIGEGEQEGEVFLNLNPVLKKGQFSIKDSDYGDIVLRQLAAVL